jgi:hypothetical protein
MKKWAKELKELFQRKQSKWLKTHEEMYKISGHKGNSNQNHVEILPHSCKNGYHQECKTQQMLATHHTLLVGI